MRVLLFFRFFLFGGRISVCRIFFFLLGGVVIIEGFGGFRFLTFLGFLRRKVIGFVERNRVVLEGVVGFLVLGGGGRSGFVVLF